MRLATQHGLSQGLRALLFVLLAGAQATQAAQIFSFNNHAEPETLDSALATGRTERVIIMALFEGLADLHPRTLEVIPGTAKAWKVSDSGTHYTFHIRENARWSNGDAVTAHDFVYAWRRVLDPKTGSQYAYNLYHIVGGREYNTGKLKDFNKVGIRATADRVLEVRLEHPTPYFLFLTSHFSLFPVHRRTLERHGPKWTRPKNIVSNGAFTLKEWRPHDRIVTMKSPRYWDAANVRLQQLNIYPLENKETVLNFYKTGKIQWSGSGNYLPDARIPQLRKRSDYHEPVRFATYFLRLNVTRPPLDNIDVRRALYLAIDRNIIASKITRSGEKAAYSLTPTMLTHYQPPQGPQFNPSKAAEHLSRAGFCAPGYNKKGCKPFPKVEMLYNTDERHKQIFLAIQQMWKQHLGIKHASLLNREWKVYLKEQRAKQYMVSRSGWIGDYPDPITFLEMFMSDSGLNYTGWGHAKYDELVTASHSEVNPKRREKILQEAEAVLLEELPIIPLLYYTTSYLLDSRVGGHYENYLDLHPYKAIYIKEDRR